MREHDQQEAETERCAELYGVADFPSQSMYKGEINQTLNCRNQFSAFLFSAVFEELDFQL